MHSLERWVNHPERGQPFVAARSEDSRAPNHGVFPSWVPTSVRQALARRGIETPYSHQSQALQLIGERRDVVVATPTASGKTLIYNVPVLTACLEDPEARALYLFPTKALAHDQTVEFEGLARAVEGSPTAHTYDGDTPADARRAIRATARVVITNPDMLHSGILPQHSRWQALFSGLRYVVVDEIHAYRGVFGSHVANVLRRLGRVAQFHGRRPRYILCSATIANAAEHAAALTEREVALVNQSGAPRGQRSFYIYNPPIVDGARGIRGSYVQAARRIARTLARDEVPTIVFANSRLNVERLTRHLREDVARDGGNPESVAGYRGGYLPGQRRAIERGLRSGEIQMVVSTSALELGIDIGQLDAAILAGYPGSIASALQRSGRAGRRSSASTVVLVARNEPVDQYIAGRPEFFFERSPEHARIDRDNLLIVAEHIKCAAFELPFEVGEAFGTFSSEDTHEVLAYLGDHSLIYRGERRWHWTAEPFPSHGVGLRAIAEGNFVVLDRAHDHCAVGEVDYHSAAGTLYPQAIYSVGGDTYQVLSLDWEGRRADVEPVHVDYYTDAMTYDGVIILDTFDERGGTAAVLGHGEVRVFERVVGFKKIRYATGENLGFGEVRLPELELHTTAFWLRPRPGLMGLAKLSRHRIVDALEGLGHALRHVAAVHLMCEPRDLGVSLVDRESPAPPEVDELPVLFLFERYPGGVGFHVLLYAAARMLLQRVAALLEGCRCDDGCPACVGAPAAFVTTDAEVRSRRAVRQVLDVLIRTTPHPDVT